MSICRLSVTLRRTHSVEIFGNIFAPSNSLGTWAVCIIILGKVPRGSTIGVEKFYNDGMIHVVTFAYLLMSFFLCIG